MEDGFESNVLNDAEVVYQRYNPSIQDKYNIVLNARNGLSTKAFYDIVMLTGIKKEELAEIFNTTMKTIMRYTQADKTMDITNSEQALKIIALFKQGNELFGDIQSFRNWLAKPQYGLGRQIPFQLMHTSLGIDLISEELSRIEYGANA
jgi:putative toxin-antitoxin system antitoxin component (TIGR02293 family)